MIEDTLEKECTRADEIASALPDEQREQAKNQVTDRFRWILERLRGKSFSEKEIDSAVFCYEVGVYVVGAKEEEKKIHKDVKDCISQVEQLCTQLCTHLQALPGCNVGAATKFS